MSGYNLPDDCSASDESAPWNQEYEDQDEESNGDPERVEIMREDSSTEFYKKMYNAKTVCWCGGELELNQDGHWWIQKCKKCGQFVRAYMIIPGGGYAT